MFSIYLIVENRTLTRNFHPLPSANRLLEAGIYVIGKLTVVLNADARELHDAISALRLGTQVSPSLSDSASTYDGIMLTASSHPIASNPAIKPTILLH